MLIKSLTKCCVLNFAGCCSATWRRYIRQFDSRDIVITKKLIKHYRKNANLMKRVCLGRRPDSPERARLAVSREYRFGGACRGATVWVSKCTQMVIFSFIYFCCIIINAAGLPFRYHRGRIPRSALIGALRARQRGPTEIDRSMGRS